MTEKEDIKLTFFKQIVKVARSGPPTEPGWPNPINNRCVVLPKNITPVCGFYAVNNYHCVVNGNVCIVCSTLATRKEIIGSTEHE